MTDFVLRAIEAADLPFVFNSFLKSFRDAPAMSSIPNTLYYAGQHRVIERLLKNGHAIIACSKEDPTQIYGYVLVGAPAQDTATLHWLYVKHPFRGFGIGKTLEAAAVHKAQTVCYTHRTKAVERLIKNRPHYVFNPFLLMDLAA